MTNDDIKRMTSLFVRNNETLVDFYLPVYAPPYEERSPRTYDRNEDDCVPVRICSVAVQHRRSHVVNHFTENEHIKCAESSRRMLRILYRKGSTGHEDTRLFECIFRNIDSMIPDHVLHLANRDRERTIATSDIEHTQARAALRGLFGKKSREEGHVGVS